MSYKKFNGCIVTPVADGLWRICDAFDTESLEAYISKKIACYFEESPRDTNQDVQKCLNDERFRCDRYACVPELDGNLTLVSPEVVSGTEEFALTPQEIAAVLMLGSVQDDVEDIRKDSVSGTWFVKDLRQIGAGTGATNPQGYTFGREEYEEIVKKPAEPVYRVYHNVLTHEYKQLHTRLVTLSEFVQVLESVYKMGIVGETVMKLLSHTNTNSDALRDMQDLCGILQRKTPSDAQKKHTETFVKLHKDNSFETDASVVVERVRSYLSDKLECVNMNRIGQDLVDLGVKKTRKSRGFVYNMRAPSVLQFS
jgi:hypothetical protein